MKNSRPAPLGRWMVVALLALIAFGLAIDIVLTVRVSATIESLRPRSVGASQLPCPAIPTRLILEDPACAQKLLSAMNVSNVRIGAAP